MLRFHTSLPLRAGLCALAVSAGYSRAAQYTWTAVSFLDNENWTEGGNWTGGTSASFPGASSFSNDSAVFPAISAGYQVTATGTLGVSLMTFNGPGYTFRSNGTFFTNGGITATSANAPTLQVNGFLALGGNAIGRNLTGSGNVYAFNSGSSTASTLTLVGSSTDFAGRFLESGALLSLTIGDGTNTASARFTNTQNTYTGTTLVTANATLQSGAANSLGASSAHTVNGTLSLSGGSSNIGGLSGNGLVSLGANTLTVNGGGNFSGTTSGSGGFVKSGAGTLYLTGNNILHNGGTTVSAGTLQIAGVLAGNVSISSGATFTGSGGITGTMTMAGTWAPGTSPGTNTVSGFTLESTATLVMELGGTTAGSGHDQILASGGGILDGTLNVIWTNGFTAQAGDSFLLISGAGLSGSFDTVTLPTLNRGLTWNYVQTASQVSLNVQAIPEPATTWLAAALTGTAILRRRRG